MVVSTRRHPLTDTGFYEVDLVFSGEYPETTRARLTYLAQNHGHKVRTGYAKSRTNLVVATPHSILAGTAKVRKAMDAGVEVMTYGEYLSQFTRAKLFYYSVKSPSSEDFLAPEDVEAALLEDILS